MASAMILSGVWMSPGERPIAKGSAGSRQGLLFVFTRSVEADEKSEEGYRTERGRLQWKVPERG